MVFNLMMYDNEKGNFERFTGEQGIYYQAVENYARRMARNGRHNDLQPLCR